MLSTEQLQDIKNRFGIIGNDAELNHAIMKAVQIASTDLPVLITGESGVGKESIPKIIHQFSPRKHNKIITVNCGAIPEGTMDSELFGHEKGSFTGALTDRKGYFEVADGGTIFLDEVGELPLPTQARLLRILQYGEYYRVGSSEVKKTDVRVIAATNINMMQAISNGKFRQDLYYRLNAIPINLPPLRERQEDILPLFKKFANDFAEAYHRPVIKLQQAAVNMLTSYYWQGNIRQLKNVAEQISAVETNPDISAETLSHYLPDESQSRLPLVVNGAKPADDFSNERELLYKVLFDMKHDMDELKKAFAELKASGIHTSGDNKKQKNIQQFEWKEAQLYNEEQENIQSQPIDTEKSKDDDTVSVSDMEKELIKKVLDKYKGKRSLAAAELGISERTLYRRLVEYGLTK